MVVVVIIQVLLVRLTTVHAYKFTVIRIVYNQAYVPEFEFSVLVNSVNYGNNNF